MRVTRVSRRRRLSEGLARKVSASFSMMVLYPRGSRTRWLALPNWLKVRFSPAIPKTSELVSGVCASSQSN